MLVLKDIAKTYDGKTVLKKIDLSFSTGDVVGLVGIMEKVSQLYLK